MPPSFNPVGGTVHSWMPLVLIVTFPEIGSLISRINLTLLGAFTSSRTSIGKGVGLAIARVDETQKKYKK